MQIMSAENTLKSTPPVTPLSSSKSNLWMDRLGVCLSALCILHCLLTPVVLLALPLTHHWALSGDHLFHWFMALVLFVLAALAFGRGYYQHRKVQVLYLGAMGLSLLLSGLAVTEHHSHVHHNIHWTSSFFHSSLILTVAGSLILIWAHMQNIKWCRCQCHN